MSNGVSDQSRALEELRKQFPSLVPQTSPLHWSGSECSYYQEEGVVKDLSLAKLGLQEIPRAVEELSELRQLNLRGNMLQTLPKEFTNLGKLQKINLSLNHFTSFPPSLDLPFLESIDLSHNKIGRLPDSVNLPCLHELNLSYNPLRNLPLSWVELPNLESLFLGFTELDKDLRAAASKGMMQLRRHLGQEEKNSTVLSKDKQPQTVLKRQRRVTSRSMVVEQAKKSRMNKRKEENTERYQPRPVDVNLLKVRINGDPFLLEPNQSPLNQELLTAIMKDVRDGVKKLPDIPKSPRVVGLISGGQQTVVVFKVQVEEAYLAFKVYTIGVEALLLHTYCSLTAPAFPAQENLPKFIIPTVFAVGLSGEYSVLVTSWVEGDELQKLHSAGITTPKVSPYSRFLAKSGYHADLFLKNYILASNEKSVAYIDLLSSIGGEQLQLFMEKYLNWFQ